MNSHFDETKIVPYIDSDMAWAKPKYTRERVDAVGKLFITKQPVDFIEAIKAIQVINNWRASHYFPLNTLQIGLRNKAHSIYPRSLIAQRIKRMSSIQVKLRNMPHLTLSKMQDIGGCRAVVGSVQNVRKLVELYGRSWQRHELIKSNDYINNPKSSGYRSYHLIYAYKSDRNKTYNGLRIEIQIRSPLQHYWATAVETVGAFTRQALKSGEGQDSWLRFFALMGTVIANKENTPRVPNTPSNADDLIIELRDHVRRLGVIRKLQAYSAATHYATTSKDKDVKYSLLVLNVPKRKVEISNYSKRELERAFKDYADVEDEIKNKEGVSAVLASTDSFRQLKRAYPNYFLDTGEFLKIVNEALQ